RRSREGRRRTQPAARRRRRTLRQETRPWSPRSRARGRLHHASEPGEPGRKPRLGGHDRRTAPRSRVRVRLDGRRPRPVELMLLTTVVLWALNVSVTKYILEHGVAPLAYATIRYGLAGLIFIGLALVAERTLRIARTDVPRVALASLTLALNQL